MGNVRAINEPAVELLSVPVQHSERRTIGGVADVSSLNLRSEYTHIQLPVAAIKERAPKVQIL